GDDRRLDGVATYRGGIRRRVVVGDLAGPARVADVEDPHPRPDPRARQRRGVVRVVDGAVVAAVGQRRRGRVLAEDDRAVGGIVDLQRQLGDDPRVRDLADVDHPREAERRLPGLTRAVGNAPGGTHLVAGDDVGPPADAGLHADLRHVAGPPADVAAKPALRMRATALEGAALGAR